MFEKRPRPARETRVAWQGVVVMSTIPKEEFNDLSKEPGLDFEALFLQKIGVESVQKEDFFRKAALTFRLRKPEARVLLRRLLARGLAIQDGRTITFKEATTA